ncbi:MAG: ABC transporter ATP-binding protein [Anaerolineae bacterium]|nr:ABC transporter ATP-binding protein [Anaerolineae bacterium]
MPHSRPSPVGHARQPSGPVRWLASHVLRYPLLPLGTALAAILSHVLGARAPIYLGRAIDHALAPAPSARTLLALSLAMLGFRMGEVALDVVYRIVGEVLSRRIQRDMREEVVGALLDKSLSFHAMHRVGDLTTRATDDARTVNYMFSPGLRGSLNVLVLLVVRMVAIGALDPALLTVPGCALAGAGYLMWRYVRRIRPLVDAQRAQLGAMNAGLSERLAGIEVIQSSAQEGQERARFAGDAASARDLAQALGEIEATYLPDLVRVAAQALGFLHALCLSSQGAFSVGTVVAYVGLLSRLHLPAAVLSSLIANGLASAERMLAVLRAAGEPRETPSGVRQPAQGSVVFEDVRFAYRGQDVLKGITFAAAPGETIAIVGQTGAGKTTLTRLIDRTYDVTAGRVLIDGIDVREWQLGALRSQIATIAQDITLFARSVGENIAFGLGGEVSQGEIERCARDAEAHAFISRLPHGYDTVVGERGVTLSGGERQRVAIARAFLTDPRILILDDATSAVDSATEDRIQSAMERVRRGRTTFLITHRLSQIRRADRILVLRRGELIDQGTHEALLERCAPYRRIFRRAGPQPVKRADASTGV